jgi:hypothetical protein
LQSFDFFKPANSAKKHRSVTPKAENPRLSRSTPLGRISVSSVSEIRDDASIRVRREAVSIVTRRVEARARRVRDRFGADARETR